MAKKPKINGRPSEYSDERAAYICDEIANGRSLSSICREKDFPRISTVFRWLADDRYQDFRDMYVRARDEQAETFADAITQIADDADLDKDAISKAKLRIDTRKWVASKLKPRKYGDRLGLTDGEGGPLVVNIQKFSGD